MIDQGHRDQEVIALQRAMNNRLTQVEEDNRLLKEQQELLRKELREADKNWRYNAEELSTVSVLVAKLRRLVADGSEDRADIVQAINETTSVVNNVIRALNEVKMTALPKLAGYA